MKLALIFTTISILAFQMTGGFLTDHVKNIPLPDVPDLNMPGVDLSNLPDVAKNSLPVLQNTFGKAAGTALSLLPESEKLEHCFHDLPRVMKEEGDQERLCARVGGYIKCYVKQLKRVSRSLPGDDKQKLLDTVNSHLEKQKKGPCPYRKSPVTAASGAPGLETLLVSELAVVGLTSLAVCLAGKFLTCLPGDLL
ncbi:hypothetical protein ElyMa_003303600 [Elysia marginata]|uniref:Uncharacterized protein n=1 Tax=Elysia marginata TaxID=1093978 RepID=A0AAV4JDI9_9GAST|nr:hypothetical protein ElyMa_003303600 [Elysia marginata]